MKRQLAFVLGGGASRGALQVGALRALAEAGFTPDILVGTSVGAANAAFLAIRGFNLGSIEQLVQVWRDTTLADLLPANYLWLTVRALLNRPAENSSQRMRDFVVAHGLSPDLQFGDIHGVRLGCVACDLNTGRPVIYGLDPIENVLEAVLASGALPPWVAPIEQNGRLLTDGGVVSNLPIEPALQFGATRIIALDLADPASVPVEGKGFAPFLAKMINTVQLRQLDLELALAAACEVHVQRIPLYNKQPVPLWDFRRTDDLISEGYEIARQEIARWQAEQKPGWRGWLDRLFHPN
jgi:NTE family protein